MELKKLHMGTLVFGWDSMDEVAHLLNQTLGEGVSPSSKHRLQLPIWFRRCSPAPDARRKGLMLTGVSRGRRDMSSRVRDAVFALATCHNVRTLPSSRQATDRRR
jgi:phospholipid-translocating ATPase